MSKTVLVLSCKEGEVTVHTSYTAMLDPKGLIPHPENNNIHSQKQVDCAKKAIKSSGWRERVVVSEKTQNIVSGHLRVVVAMEMGLEKIPVDVQHFESEFEEFRFLTASNELARQAQFDDGKFLETKKKFKKKMGKNEFQESFFSSEDFGLLAFPKEEGPDVEKSLAIKPMILKEGDVWNLGPHRLELGKTTEENEMHIQKFLKGWKKVQGAPAILEATGQTYDEVFEERSSK